MQPSCQKIWTPCSNPIVVEKQQAAYSQDGSDFLLSLGLSEYSRSRGMGFFARGECLLPLRFCNGLHIQCYSLFSPFSILCACFSQGSCILICLNNCAVLHFLHFKNSPREGVSYLEDTRVGQSALQIQILLKVRTHFLPRSCSEKVVCVPKIWQVLLHSRPAAKISLCTLKILLVKRSFKIATVKILTLKCGKFPSITTNLS